MYIIALAVARGDLLERSHRCLRLRDHVVQIHDSDAIYSQRPLVPRSSIKYPPALVAASRQKKDEIRLWFIHLLRLTSSSSVQSVEVTKPPDCPSRSFLSFTYQICPKSQPKGAWREKEMRSAESESHGEGLFNSSSMDSPGLTKRPLGPMSRFIVTFHSRVLSVELESVGVGCGVKSETSRSSELNHPVAVARLIANRRGQRIYFRSQSQIAKSD
jgi:hypothetical protein